MSEPIFSKCWISPLTGVLFAATGVSGVLMWLHLAPGSVRSMHEWIGFASLLAVGLHIALNWRCLIRYFTGKSAIVAALAGSLLVAGFLTFGGSADDHREGARNHRFRGESPGESRDHHATPGRPGGGPWR